MSKENRHFYEFGPFRIDTRNRQLLRENEVVPLKAKAVDTLLLLIESRGDVVEKDELMQRLWPDSFVEDWPAEFGRIRWMPDGNAVAYSPRQAGVGNIWTQPLNGVAPAQLTHWNSNPIFWFDWSRDGKWLAYASGTLTSDVILISDAGH
jgi:hypothetical protein